MKAMKRDLLGKTETDYNPKWPKDAAVLTWTFVLISAAYIVHALWWY